MSEKDNLYAEYFDELEKQRAAFEQALENRRSEIDNYWKRTAYFWTLNAAALAGYFALAVHEPLANSFYAFCVGCLGTVISFSWFLANKGSKYWQENWENLVVALGGPLVGSLFQKILERTKGTVCERLNPTRPAAISVSKVNLWLSFYITGFWLMLTAFSSPLRDKFRFMYVAKHKFAIVFIATIIFTIVMRLLSRTSKGPHPSQVVFVDSTIEN